MAAINSQRKIFALLATLLLSIATNAEIPALERELNLSFQNEAAHAVLKKIEQHTGVIFSYQPAVLEKAAPFTATLRKKTVREALSLLFAGKVSYNARNNYIILKEKPEGKPQKKTEISGYVVDKNTEQKLAKVTIYDPNSLQSATSDEYGFYKITVPAGSASLSVNKQNYHDTAIVIGKPAAAPLNNIEIVPEPPTLLDSAVWKRKLHELSGKTNEYFRKFQGYVHTVNVRDSLHRDWQISFLPFIGTNHKMSANVYNRVSINVLGGYSRGVSGFEAGGLFNLNRENMSGLQFAGLFNVAGDSAKGFQGAGLLNVTGKRQSGFQAAGLMNVNGGRAEGTQAAGLMNINTRVEGFAAAGLMNISNYAAGAFAAGLANISDTLHGVSVAGLFNVADAGNAAQVAGLFNATGETRFQVAGLFNIAGQVRGLQLAPLNFADSASGVPIGLLSIVKHGLHQLEFSADELFLANIGFRTGVQKFYNILSLGVEPGAGATLWQAGYGVGSTFSITRKLKAELNLSMHHISKGALILGPSELYRFHPAIQYQFTKKLAIAAGPTFNLYHSDELMDEFSHTYSHIAPYSHYSRSTSNRYSQVGWIGGKVSLRFF